MSLIHTKMKKKMESLAIDERNKANIKYMLMFIRFLAGLLRQQKQSRERGDQNEQLVALN